MSLDDWIFFGLGSLALAIHVTCVAVGWRLWVVLFGSGIRTAGMCEIFVALLLYSGRQVAALYFYHQPPKARWVVHLDSSVLPLLAATLLLVGLVRRVRSLETLPRARRK